MFKNFSPDTHSRLQKPLAPPPPNGEPLFFCQVCDCHEFTSFQSWVSAALTSTRRRPASVGTGGILARCGSDLVRSHFRRRGGPPSPALRGPHTRGAAGWDLRSPVRSRPSPVRNRTGCRGSLAGPSGACSCRGRPETEAVGRPEVLPLE